MWPVGYGMPYVFELPFHSSFSLSLGRVTHPHPYNSLSGGYSAVYLVLLLNTTMMDQRSHSVYRRLLLGAGHGYPFWVPEPDQSLPIEYRNRGIRIGDVGLMTEDGGFDFLFNIHHEATHPMNGGRVPPGFRRLPHVERPGEIPLLHQKKCTITKGQVSKKALTLEASAELAPFAGGGFGLEFSVVKAEAAILFLPDGATRYYAKSRATYLKYAKENGIALYQYVNGALGREAPNGSLYIVTGCDKCRSWGTAAVAQTENQQAVSLKFLAEGLAEGNIAMHTSCSLSAGVESRCYPPTEGAPSFPEENQCVFARGIVIVLRENLFTSTVLGAVQLTHISGSQKEGSWRPPSSGWVPYSSASSSFNSSSPSSSSTQGGQSRDAPDQSLSPTEESSMESLTPDESNVVASVEYLPEYSTLPLNPCFYLGEHALFTCPSADLVVVEDETWITALELDENGAVDMNAVLRKVLEQNHLEEFDGVAIFNSNTPLHDSQSEVKVSDKVDILQGSSRVSSTSMVQPSQIYALIIGIDVYQNSEWPALGAAVADGKRFEEYLIQDLQVPTDNILHLFNEQATRRRIVDALRRLSTDESIIKDKSAIIVFYAGHGASSPKPAEWEDWATSGGQLEMLCPVDMGELDEANQVIEGVPDRTISVLLDEISREKGNNITFILDCCFSAGMTRAFALGEIPEDAVARIITAPPPITSTCDADIWSAGSRSVSIVGITQQSHVLLAACHSGQSAYEYQGSGLFTRCLLKVLRDYPITELTYSSLMHRLRAPGYQTPHCEGKHVRRRLFNAWNDEADNAFILCKHKQGVPNFILDAGSLHGITLGSEYAVYDTDIPSASARYTKASITQVDSFTSILVPSDPTFPTARENQDSSVWYARLTKDTDTVLQIFCNDASYIQRILDTSEEDSDTFVTPISSVDDAEVADLILTVDDGQVYFDRGAKTAIVNSEVGLPSRLSGSVPVSAIHRCRHVVNAYARFVTHLTRTVSAPDGKDVVAISLKRLEKSGPLLSPVGDELFTSETEPIVVYVDKGIGPERQPRYGMMFENTSDVPLYLHLFCFDPNTLAITSWYEPKIAAGAGTHSSTTVEAELNAGDSLSIGFGNGGVVPWMFYLAPEQDVDVSFFKAFLSTRPTYMRSIAQDSPFESQRNIRRDATQLPSLSSNGFWVTKILTIIQRATA